MQTTQKQSMNVLGSIRVLAEKNRLYTFFIVLKKGNIMIRVLEHGRNSVV